MVRAENITERGILTEGLSRLWGKKPESVTREITRFSRGGTSVKVTQITPAVVSVDVIRGGMQREVISPVIKEDSSSITLIESDGENVRQTITLEKDGPVKFEGGWNLGNK